MHWERCLNRDGGSARGFENGMGTHMTDKEELPRAETPTVSVVIPTHNRCTFLPSAVRSAAEQSLSPQEILIVDDGSTDETPKTCGKLSQTFPMVRSIHTQKRGLGAARNVGLRAALGTWIAFLDDDDLWHPEALQAMVEKAEATGNNVAACHGLRFFSDTPDMTAREVLMARDVFRVDHWPSDPPIDGIRLDHLLARPLVLAHGVVFLRDFLLRLGGYREDLGAAEDYELLLRVALEVTIPVVDRGLALYRWHQGQMSAHLAQQAAETRRAIEGFLDAHPEALFRVDPPAIRRRLSRLAQEEAYAALLKGEGAVARDAARRGMARCPWLPKLYFYWMAGVWPRAYLALKSSLQPSAAQGGLPGMRRPPHL